MFCLTLACRVCGARLSIKGITRRAWRPFCTISLPPHDPLHDEGDEYAAKLKAANVAVDHTPVPNSFHEGLEVVHTNERGFFQPDLVWRNLRFLRPTRLGTFAQQRHPSSVVMQ